MPAQKWILQIDGDSSGATNAVDGVSAKTIAMGNILADVAKAGVEMLVSGIMRLGDELKKSVGAAAEAQRNAIMLGGAMAQAGTYSRDAFKATMDYASALQKSTVYGDDQINVVQKLLTNFGLEGDALNKATKATLDLAAAKGMDLASAGDLVAKSIGTETNALKRYGIDIADTTDKTERAAAVVEGITKLFGGSAQAQANTFSGRIAQLGNAFNDLQEEVGAVITNNEGLTEVFNILKKAIEGATAWVAEHKAQMAELVKTGIVYLIKGLEGLVVAIDFLAKMWVDAGNIMLHVFSGLTSAMIAYTQVVALINPRMQGYVDALKNMKAATEEEIAAGTKSKEEKSLFFKTLVDGLKVVEGQIAGVKVAFKETGDSVDEYASKNVAAVATVQNTTQALIDLAVGYTVAEQNEYLNQKTNLESMAQMNMITWDQYYAYVLDKGKKFNDGDALLMEQRKTNVANTYATIFQLSTACYQSILSGQKSFGAAMEDAWKASARAILDAEIDKAIKSIGLIEAVEAAKATMGGFLSFGATLLFIPLISAAAAAAKALIHSVVGFEGGGMVGAGGTKLPFPSFASAGSGAGAIVMAHEGEAIGTPATLAAAGIGGVNVYFNNYGALNSNIDIEEIGNIIGEKIKDKMRGTL